MASKPTPKRGGVANKVRKVQPLFGTEKYPDIPIGSIEIVERPPEGEEDKQLFFNPRPSEDFTLDSMAELRQSIRIDGLLQGLVVRTVGDEKGKEPQAVQLVAGERRLRTLQKLVEDNVPVYCPHDPPDEWQPEMVVIHTGRFAQVTSASPLTVRYFDENDVLADESEEVDSDDLRPTRPAADVYGLVPCKVVQRCSDKDALRIATTENLKRKTLSVAAQIALAERLVKMGMTQKQIVEALGTNITWVSQTLGFRQDLPADAFECLLANRLKRHVAVGFLSYAPQHRQRLFEETVKKAEEETIAKIRSARIEAESHEDMVDVEQTKAKNAAKLGDTAAAARHKEKASAEQKKVTKAKKRLARVQKEQGQIKQTHLQTAAATLGIAPKKASKMLTKPEIESLIERLREAAETKTTDPVVGKAIPPDYASLGALFLEGVLEGLRDPFKPIRDQMVEEGNWEVEDDGDVVSDDDNDGDEFADDAYGDDEDYDDDADREMEAFGIHEMDDESME